MGLYFRRNNNVIKYYPIGELSSSNLNIDTINQTISKLTKNIPIKIKNKNLDAISKKSNFKSFINVSI